jgi:REP element-mobilizing transposase RayT
MTTVIHGRESTLGTIVDGTMCLSKSGQIVHGAWVDLPRHYTHIQLDEFCIMPNHFHGIIIILDRDKSRRGGSNLSAKASLPEGEISGEGCSPAQETRPYRNRYPLSEFIRAFKSFSARRINVLLKTPGLPVWQRNYYKHIIRDEDELGRIRQYIQENPLRWALDELNEGLVR